MTTPQEDEELRRMVTYQLYDGTIIDHKMAAIIDKAFNFIKAHSEKVALEARISELKRHNEDHGDCPTNCMGVRIAGLQAQLNNLTGK